MTANTRRKVVLAARWLHTHVAMFALLAMSGFAVTGLMLNHSEWFGLDEIRTETLNGTLPRSILQPVDKLAIVERLRSQFGATGAVEGFDVEEEELVIDFQRPGRRTRAVVDRADGGLEVVTEIRGVAAILTDLHKGAAAGSGWKPLIDLTAVLLILAAVTGVIVWLSLPKRRVGGAVALLLGAGVWITAYLLLIPK